LRHLVSSTRFVFNYAKAYLYYDNPEHLHWVEHGIRFLLEQHRQDQGHFAWELRDNNISDNRAMAYGHAFVMLAGASAYQAGNDSGKELVEISWELLESLFWLPEFNAYADERDGSLKNLNDYRGQNANMHSCEAMLAAWEATREALFKPWGFQPGHQVEWTKLLLQLYSHQPEDWMLERATSLFDTAMQKGWDQEYGGLVYGFAPDGSFCDANKYFWVQAEAFAAAMRLYKISHKQRYLDDYMRIWEWSWKHLVDHQQGAWFRIRTREGNAIDDLKSPPGKTDYHTMGACWDVIETLQS